MEGLGPLLRGVDEGGWGGGGGGVRGTAVAAATMAPGHKENTEVPAERYGGAGVG